MDSPQALPGASVPGESAEITTGTSLGIQAALIRPEESFALSSTIGPRLALRASFLSGRLIWPKPA